MADFMNLFGAMNQTAQMFQQKQEREGKPPVEWEFSSDKNGQPMASFTMDAETAMNIHKAMENYGQIMASMQQELGRIQQQEERQRRGLGPLMSVLSQVSGELAQDKRLPPVVSALGRANLALNPPPQALRQEKLGILGAMGEVGAQQGRMAMEMGQARVAQQRVALEEQRQERLERSGMINQLNQQAMRGDLTDPAIVEKILSSLPGMAPDKAKTMAAELVGASQQRQAAIAAKEAATDERQKRMLEEKERESERRMQAMFAGMAMRESMFERKLEAQKEAEERKKTGKEMEVPKTIPEKLAHLKSAESTLDQIEAGLQKYRKYQGIVAGRTVEPVAAYFKPDVAKFFNKIKLQVSQAIQSTGAGARGFGPWERGYFTSMTEAKTHSPEENLGIIQSWRDYLRAQRDSYMAAYKGLAKPDTAAVLGKDKDLLDQYGSQAAPASGETATRRRDPQGAWWIYKDGKWQKE